MGNFCQKYGLAHFAQFFLPIYYILLIFFSRLIREKSGKVGQKCHEALKIKGFRGPLCYFKSGPKVGQKWAKSRFLRFFRVWPSLKVGQKWAKNTKWPSFQNKSGPKI